MMEPLIHFFKHLIGLCGEQHPSLLVSGGALFAAVGLWWKQGVAYVKGWFS